MLSIDVDWMLANYHEIQTACFLPRSLPVIFPREALTKEKGHLLNLTFTKGKIFFLILT